MFFRIAKETAHLPRACQVRVPQAVRVRSYAKTDALSLKRLRSIYERVLASGTEPGKRVAGVPFLSLIRKNMKPAPRKLLEHCKRLFEFFIRLTRKSRDDVHPERKHHREAPEPGQSLRGRLSLRPNCTFASSASRSGCARFAKRRENGDKNALALHEGDQLRRNFNRVQRADA